MGTTYLTRDELDRRERRHVTHATWMSVLGGGVALVPLLFFVHTWLEAVAETMPPGAYEVLWIPVVPTLVLVAGTALPLVRFITRHRARQDRHSHQQIFERDRAATLERLFGGPRST